MPVHGFTRGERGTKNRFSVSFDWGIFASEPSFEVEPAEVQISSRLIVWSDEKSFSTIEGWFEHKPRLLTATDLACGRG